MIFLQYQSPPPTIRTTHTPTDRSASQPRRSNVEGWSMHAQSWLFLGCGIKSSSIYVSRSVVRRSTNPNVK